MCLWLLKRLNLFFLLFVFFCFPLVSDSASELENTKQHEQITSRQKKKVTLRLKTSEDKLTNLEELAKMYLDELEKSDKDWKKLSTSYETLRTVVKELTISVELWSQKYKSLSKSYETVKGTLESEREETEKIVSSLEKELQLYKSCAIISGVGIACSVIFYILK